MAVMGLRLGQRANGVAKLHGVVCRGMFYGLWPGFDHYEVPITSVTNGVHVPTWVDRTVYELAAQAPRRRPTSRRQRRGTARRRPRRRRLGDRSARCASSSVEDVRRRLRAVWKKRGAADAELGWIDDVLDPDVLTIGFARRVPTYKRLTLMLRDPDRLKACCCTRRTRSSWSSPASRTRPTTTGKKMIQQLVRFTDDPEVRHRIVFLPNYDIAMAQTLFPGCDVWLNNPLRPLEACGTSGMKAALNGSLNLSILDGWWDELYDGENGWAIPTADGVEYPERPRRHRGRRALRAPREPGRPAVLRRRRRGPAAELDLDDHAHPATLGPKVLASRMVRDYTTQLYGPAARAGWALNGATFEGARDLAAYKAKVKAAWPSVHVDHVESSGVGDSPEIGETLHVRAYVSLGGLTPDEVDVQVVHGTARDTDELRDVVSESLQFVESYEGGRHQLRG